MNAKVNLWSRFVERAIIEENTDFLDEEFDKSDDFKTSHDAKGYSMLHFAVQRSTERMVRYFLNKGVSPDGTTNTGQTALHVVVRHYRQGTMDLLLNHGCPIEGKDEIGRTPLYLAVEEFSGHFVDDSIDLDIIRHLLHRGADVNATTCSGDTPLFQAIKHRSELLVRLLVSHGADIYYRRGGHGANALHRAVQTGNKGIVKILLDAGIEANSVLDQGPFEGGTALHLAVSSAKNEEIVNLLIERGAMVNAKDQDNETPIFMAVRAFCSDGASCNKQTLVNCFESIVKLLLARGADVRCKNRIDRTVLHLAVRYATKKVVEMLIVRGAPINDRNSNGDSPLHLAVLYRKEKHVNLLLAKGADVNVTDFDGCTPLLHAARSCTPFDPRLCKIVDILLDNGADPLLRSTSNKSPLDYALEELKNIDMIAALLRYVALWEAMGNRRATGVLVARGIDNYDRRLQIVQMCHQYCQLSIARVREVTIYRNVSYFDMITRDLDTWVKNDEFVKAFENNQAIRDFIFYEKVSRRFKDALKRKDLSENAVEYLFKLLRDANLPIPNLEKILKFLGLYDLENFVLFCQETGEFK